MRYHKYINFISMVALVKPPKIYAALNKEKKKKKHLLQ